MNLFVVGELVYLGGPDWGCFAGYRAATLWEPVNMAAATLSTKFSPMILYPSALG